MVVTWLTNVTDDMIVTAVTYELAVATVDHTVVAVEMDGCDSYDGCDSLDGCDR